MSEQKQRVMMMMLLQVPADKPMPSEGLLEELKKELEVDNDGSPSGIFIESVKLHPLGLIDVEEVGKRSEIQIDAEKGELGVEA